MRPTVAVFAAALLGSWMATSSADPIGPGFDLLKAPKGKVTLKEIKGISLPAPLDIPLVGKPFKPSKNIPGIMGKEGKLGNTNFIVERKDKRPPKTDRFDIELVALSLKGKEPIRVGNKGKFKAFVSLDRANPSTGNLKVKSHDDKKGGGGFDIFDLNIFLQVDLLPIGGNDSDPISELVRLGKVSSKGGSWSHGSTQGYPTIPSFPAGNFYGNPLNLFDGAGLFTLSGLLPAQAAEPVTLALVGSGLMLIGLGRTRRPAH